MMFDDEKEKSDSDPTLVTFFPPEVVLKYIEEYVTTDYKMSSDGEWCNIDSEFTSDDKKKMGFNLRENYVNDFRLGGMSLVRFVQEHEGLNDPLQAKTLLATISIKMKKGFKKVTRQSLENRHIETRDCAPIDDLPEVKSFFNPLSPIGKKALEYLEGRGISEKHIRKYDLSYSDNKKCPKCYGDGYNDDEDQCSFCNGTGKNFFYARVIIPTYEKGNLIYLQGRTINNYGNDLRYQNIKAPRLQVVYFYDLLKSNEDIFITEGPIDAMTLYDYNVTSLLNTRISEPQINKILSKNPKRIIFVPDYDETLAKRERVGKTLAENMLKVMNISNNSIDVGIYEWHKMLADKGKKFAKDINEAQLTYVDEKYIKIYDDVKLKFVTEKEDNRIPWLADDD